MLRAPGTQRPVLRSHTYGVSLEGFDGAVTAESADVDTHVGAARGEGRVVLPVHIERGRCGVGQRGDTCIYYPCTELS